MADKVFMCIDLKSFYASVECVDRGLDPFKTNLVVADPARGRGGIILHPFSKVEKNESLGRGDYFSEELN